MSWGRDFEELADKLEELADQFESKAGSQQPRDPETGRFQSKEGRFDPKQRISNGISRSLEHAIVPEAKRGAKRNVPAEDARTITQSSAAWNRHYLVSTSDLVKYHEYGTSTRASDPAKGTVNAPSGGGYVIPREGYDSLPFGPDQVGMMDELNFQFVVHPGVEGKHFMRDALMNNLWVIEDNVAEELDEIDLDV